MDQKKWRKVWLSVGEPYLQIRMKDWAALPIPLKQQLLLHLPQVWLIWKPVCKWLPWLGGKWVPNNLSLK